jgi:polysaccharide export outer membrane protein
MTIQASTARWRSYGISLRLRALSIALVFGLGGCAVRTPDARAPIQGTEEIGTPYLIKVGDSLDIRFYKTPELNIEVLVRSDGKISLELIGDVQAAGLRPEELSAVLTEKYSSELTEPRVSVIVRSFGGTIYVGGEVRTPSGVPYATGLTALQAIDGAGGFLDSARKTNVVLIRREGEQYKGYTLALTKTLTGEDFDQNVRLQPYDIIHVPRSRISNVNVFVEQYIRNNLPVQPAIPIF